MPTTKSNSLIKIIVSFIIVTLITIAIIFFSFITGMGECFGDVGPFHGQKVQISLDTITIDKSIEIPNGKLIFSNTQDSINPLLIKLDSNNEVLWSYRLDTDEDEYISLYKIGSIKLSENGNIDFFNHSFSEPGRIHLDENYDFDCVCLKFL